MALCWRRRSGRGQHIDLSQAENMVHHLSQAVMDYSLNERSQSTLGNGHPWMAPHDIFPCRDLDVDAPAAPGWPGEKAVPPHPDRWVAIAIADDDEWERFCRAIDRPELVDDERFATVTARRAHGAEARREISAWTLQRTAVEAMAALQSKGVRAGALHTAREVLDDPQHAARGFLERVDVPYVGEYPWVGAQAKLSATPLHIRRYAPRLGEDNEYVYREVLGVGADEYEELVREEHIGDTYVSVARPREAAKP
jgi:crotonobetainyl-CoA:carnitine CoA-transferase CaiB-like acyl-CoA transferase